MGFLSSILGAGGTKPSMQIKETPIWQYIQPQFARLAQGESYDVPDIGSILPSKDWFEQLPTGVLESFYQPHEQMMEQMANRFAGAGMLGSARGGASGAFGRALGEYSTQIAEPDIMARAMSYTQPYLAQEWQANLAQNMAPFMAAMNLAPQAFTGMTMPGQQGLLQQLLPAAGMGLGTYFGGALGG